MRKFQLSNVSSPSIMFECGGHLRNSLVIKDTKKNPNFVDPVLFFDVVSRLPAYFCAHISYRPGLAKVRYRHGRTRVRFTLGYL